MKQHIYADDKPRDCRYCYFYKRRGGCTLGTEHCFYLLDKAEGDASPCCGCPYGRASPCIGFCMRKVLEEMKAKRKGGKRE